MIIAQVSNGMLVKEVREISDNDQGLARYLLDVYNSMPGFYGDERHYLVDQATFDALVQRAKENAAVWLNSGIPSDWRSHHYLLEGIVDDPC